MQHINTEPVVKYVSDGTYSGHTPIARDLSQNGIGQQLLKKQNVR